MIKLCYTLLFADMMCCFVQTKKAGKKGKAVDGSMLGFATGTDYSLLERPER